MTAPEVVAVGSAIVDRYYRLSNLPEPDGGAFVHESWEGFGGVAANVACAASHLGRSTGMVARLGSDGDADAVAADLRGHGVDTARLQRGEEPSTYSMILVAPDGERMIVTGGEAARALSLAEADLAYARSARAVFTNGYVPDRATRPLVAARAAGELPPLVFDLSGPLAELEGRGTTPGTVDEMVTTADLFVADAVSLRSYLAHHGVEGLDLAGAADLLRERGVRRAALTRGADGALLVEGGDAVHVPAYDVDVVDATGAGDAFVAGLVDAWVLEGRSPAEAGRHAAAVAALDCTAEGARGNLPDAESVRRFRAERE
jgi:sugar/nucleoside kinase (ribokinase family)